MIEIDYSKCTGCRQCETICAFIRSGRSSRHLSRIKIMSDYTTGIDGPIICQQCMERYCLKSCAYNAITIGTLGQIIISPTICNNCGACEISCPIGAINTYNDILYVCDLCGGRPQCVEVCTEKAIQYSPDKMEIIEFKKLKEETKEMNNSEKQFFFLSSKGEGIRNNWRKKNA